MSLAGDIISLTTKVTREWTKQRKAEERGRHRSTRQYVYSDRVDFTEVMDDILPAGYAHASGGEYSVSKRQFFYAVREKFKEWTGRELEFNYFAGTLLVQYMNRNPGLGWRVTADPRGSLTVPNTAHPMRVPCGTIAIDNYLHAAGKACDPYDSVKKKGLSGRWPSVAAGQRYQGVLYIEKEGFEPLLKEARIAEKFDLAILSCKGQSVVAARRFVDEVCAVGCGVPLFVVHDFDKAGFEISQRLTRVSEWAEDNDRVTYQFRNQIDATDLGLRLYDVQNYGLQGEPCPFKGHFAGDSIATPEEQAFLRSGRRVELNEFTAPQFVEWLEGKLTGYLPKRLIPRDDVLEKAYRRALVVAAINKAIQEAREGAIENAKAAAVPKGLRRRLAKLLKDSPRAWDQVLYDMMKSKLYPQDGD